MRLECWSKIILVIIINKHSIISLDCFPCIVIQQCQEYNIAATYIKIETKFNSSPFVLRCKFTKWLNLLQANCFTQFYTHQKQLKNHDVHCKTNCVLLPNSFSSTGILKSNRQFIVNPNSTHNRCE